MTVRLPDDIHARLKNAADRNRRSLHAQLLIFVELGLSLDEGSPAGLASFEATEEIYRRAVEGIPRRSRVTENLAARRERRELLRSSDEAHVSEDLARGDDQGKDHDGKTK